MEKVKIKDLIFNTKNLSFQESLEYLVGRAKNKCEKTFVVTINPEILMIATKNSDYLNVIKSANLALPDGIGIILAGKIFGKPFKEKVTGVDLMEQLCELVSKQPITVGFLGGRKNVAEKTAECLRSNYPGLNVAFAVEEWNIEETLRSHSQFENFSDASTPASRRAGLGGTALADSNEKFSHENAPRVSNPKSSILNHQSCDILFVAFGPPKQEFWIYDNLPNIDIRVAIGVGGAFDFISGRVRRAPLWVRRIGFEWLFRLIIQPWRIKRQLALPKFVILVLIERFFGNWKHQ